MKNYNKNKKNSPLKTIMNEWMIYTLFSISLHNYISKTNHSTEQEYLIKDYVQNVCQNSKASNYIFITATNLYQQIKRMIDMVLL